MNRVAIGQSMVLRQSRKDPRLPQHDAIAVCRQWCPGNESDVEMALCDPGEMFAGRAFDDLHGDRGVVLAIAAEQVAQEATRDRRQNADPDHALGAASGTGGRLHRVIDLRESRAGPLQKPAPRLREPDTGRVALEQRHAQFVLQRPNTAADGRLPDTENLCGAAEAQMLGYQKRLCDGNEVNHASASNVNSYARVQCSKIGLAIEA